MSLIKIHPTISQYLRNLSGSNVNPTYCSIFVHKDLGDDNQFIFYYDFAESAFKLKSETGKKSDTVSIPFSGKVSKEHKFNFQETKIKNDDNKDPQKSEAQKAQNQVICNFIHFTEANIKEYSLEELKDHKYKINDLQTFQFQNTKHVIDILWSPFNKDHKIICFKNHDNANYSIGYYSFTEDTHDPVLETELIYLPETPSCICIDESDDISWYSFNIYVAMNRKLVAYAPFAHKYVENENEKVNEGQNKTKRKKLSTELPKNQQISFLEFLEAKTNKMIPSAFPLAEEFEADIVSMKLFDGNLYVSLKNGKVIHFKVKPILFGEEKHNLELEFIDEKKFNIDRPMLSKIQKGIFVIHDKEIIPYYGELIPSISNEMILKKRNKEIETIANTKYEILKKKEEELQKRREELEQRKSELPDTNALLKKFTDLNAQITEKNELFSQLYDYYQKLLDLEEHIKQEV